MQAKLVYLDEKSTLVIWSINSVTNSPAAKKLKPVCWKPALWPVLPKHHQTTQQFIAYLCDLPPPHYQQPPIDLHSPHRIQTHPPTLQSHIFYIFSAYTFSKFTLIKILTPRKYNSFKKTSFCSSTATKSSPWESSKTHSSNPTKSSWLWKANPCSDHYKPMLWSLVTHALIISYSLLSRSYLFF